MRKKSFNSFTLAEVLVVISIIGIIAAETIPSIALNFQNKVTLVKFNKAYSVLSQALNMMIADSKSMEEVYSDGSNDTIRDYFCQKMKCLKEGQGSFPSTTYTYLNGDVLGNIGTTSHTALLIDGSMFDFINYDTNCTTNNDGSVFGEDAPLNLCGYIFVDLNGAEHPNIIGKDVFLFWVTSASVVPVGCPSWDDCGTGENRGQTCAYKIFTEQAINY